jgi:hypothetical protein
VTTAEASATTQRPTRIDRWNTGLDVEGAMTRPAEPSKPKKVARVRAMTRVEATSGAADLLTWR